MVILGGGYSIVQLLIEDVSGLSFEDYMKNVLEPLGMNNSTFNVTPAVMSKSTPYDENAKKISMIYFAEQAAAVYKQLLLI